MSSKFHLGDIVWIGELPKPWSHFEQNCYGIVIEVEKYREDSYEVMFTDGNSSAWYDDAHLTFCRASDRIADREYWTARLQKFAENHPKPQKGKMGLSTEKDNVDIQAQDGPQVGLAERRMEIKITFKDGTSKQFKCIGYRTPDHDETYYNIVLTLADGKQAWINERFVVSIEEL